MSPSIRLRISQGPREPRFPAQNDEALGTTLFGMLVEKLSVGVPRPASFVFWPDRVQIIDLPPLLGVPDPHRAISALTAQGEVEALAVLGVLTRQQRPPRGAAAADPRGWGPPPAPPQRFAVAFVEWNDGRWWLATRALGIDGSLIDDVGEDIVRAVDGASRPGGLGGWFARARFEGLQIRMEPHGEGGMVN